MVLNLCILFLLPSRSDYCALIRFFPSFLRLLLFERSLYFYAIYSGGWQSSRTEPGQLFPVVTRSLGTASLLTFCRLRNSNFVRPVAFFLFLPRCFLSLNIFYTVRSQSADDIVCNAIAPANNVTCYHNQRY